MYDNYEDYIRDMDTEKEMTTESDNINETIRLDVNKSLQKVFANIMARAGYSHDQAIREVVWAFDSMTDNVGHYDLASPWVRDQLERERKELADWWSVDQEIIEDMMWEELEPLWSNTPATDEREAV